jgi:hypothetical protein
MGLIQNLKDYDFTASDAKRKTADAIWRSKEDTYYKARGVICEAVEKGNYSTVLSDIPIEHKDHVSKKLEERGFVCVFFTTDRDLVNHTLNIDVSWEK